MGNAIRDAINADEAKFGEPGLVSPSETSLRNILESQRGTPGGFGGVTARVANG
jgi:hypothetical protein